MRIAKIVSFVLVFFTLLPPAQATEDYYAILGVDKTASIAEINIAARRKIRQFHPDNNGGDRSHEPELQRVIDAKDVLTNQEKRTRYDLGQPLVVKSAAEQDREGHAELLKVKAPIRLWGAQPDPNAGNPMRTLEDLGRIVWVKVPQKPIWDFGRVVAHEIRGTLDQMTAQIFKGIEAGILTQMENVPSVLSIFSVTSEWISTLPERVDYSADRIHNDIVEVNIRLAQFRAMSLWIEKIRPYSEVLASRNARSLLRIVDGQVERGRKRMEKNEETGWRGRSYETDRNALRASELAQVDLKYFFFYDPIPIDRRLPHALTCEGIF